jgi:uncharacterized protein
LREQLEKHFEESSTPVLVALLRKDGDVLLESDRGFIVPDDWRTRAEMRIKRTA